MEESGPGCSTSSHLQNDQRAMLLGLKLSHPAAAHTFRDSWSAVPRGTGALRQEAAHVPPGYRPLVPPPGPWPPPRTHLSCDAGDESHLPELAHVAIPGARVARAVSGILSHVASGG